MQLLAQQAKSNPSHKRNEECKHEGKKKPSFQANPRVTATMKAIFRFLKGVPKAQKGFGRGGPGLSQNQRKSRVLLLSWDGAIAGMKLDAVSRDNSRRALGLIRSRCRLLNHLLEPIKENRPNGSKNTVLGIWCLHTPRHAYIYLSKQELSSLEWV